MLRRLQDFNDNTDAVDIANEPQVNYEISMLNITVGLLAVGCLVIGVAIIINPPASGNTGTVLGYLLSIILFQVGVFLLSRAHYRRLAIQIDLLFITVFLVYGSYASGGIYATSSLLFIIPLILSATTLSIRFTIMLTLLIILSFIGLYMIELVGLLPYAPLKDLPYRLTMMSLLAASVTGIISLHRRVQMMIEQQRLELQTTAERLRIQQQLTEDLAHDLRSPITVLNTSLYLMKRKQELGRDLSDSLSALEINTNKLQTMVEGFIALSHLDSELDENAHASQEIVLGNLLGSIIDMYQAYAHEDDVELNLQVNANVAVHGRTTQLDRVFSNLISNAIAYGKEGKVVEIVVDQDDGHAVIAVTDYGPGIKPEDQEKIFERFYRVGKARTATRYTGSGIGLTIVKQIIERHGGSISVESEVGEGSTFTVRLPRLHRDDH